MKVIIEDFQALEKVRLDIQGLTLLVGESSSGKSSVCRALQASLFNRFKSGQVRFGQDHATIKIKFEDSEDVLTVQRSWAGGSPRIKLGSQTYSKLGRNLPKEVSDYVNFGTLDIGGEQYLCNIHPQFQKPLLLEYSQQRVMELLSASSALDELKEAKEVVLENRTKVKGAIQAVDQMLASVTESVNKGKESIQNIKPLVESINKAVDGIDYYQSVLKNIEDYRSTSQDLEKVIFEISLYETYVSSLQQINDVERKVEKVNILREFLKKDLLFINTIVLLKHVYSQASALSYCDSLSKLRLLLESMLALEREEAASVTKHSVLTQIVKKQDEYKEYHTTRGALSTLRALSESMERLHEEEHSLVDIVENHICPICGNKVQ